MSSGRGEGRRGYATTRRSRSRRLSASRTGVREAEFSRQSVIVDELPGRMSSIYLAFAHDVVGAVTVVSVAVDAVSGSPNDNSVRVIATLQKCLRPTY